MKAPLPVTAVVLCVVCKVTIALIESVTIFNALRKVEKPFQIEKIFCNSHSTILSVKIMKWSYSSLYSIAICFVMRMANISIFVAGD